MKEKPISIRIANRTYGELSDHPLFISRKLKKKLQGSKRRDGTDLYSYLLSRGFRGGKHLIGLVRKNFGQDFKIVLSHEKSSIHDNAMIIDYEKFSSATRGKFFAVYRETGLRSAQEFLEGHFPSAFPADPSDKLPSRSEVKQVFENLSTAVDVLPGKERQRIPSKIAELMQKEDPNFLYTLLLSLQPASERLKIALQEILAKISKEKDSENAIEKLADFMEEWNLLQVTSLLGILKSRLQTIGTFEQMIHDDNTYELRGDKSIHRVLEKSMWLIDDGYWIVQSNKSLREFIGKELVEKDKKYEKKRPDFACVIYGNKLIIIEIKRPSVELKKKDLDQVEDYQLIIRKYKAKQYSSVEIFLVGSKISDEARERANLRRGISLMTYQDLLERCRTRYNEYLTILEE